MLWNHVENEFARLFLYGDDLGGELLSALLSMVVAVAFMVAAYALCRALLGAPLRRVVWQDRNRAAAAVALSALIAMGFVMNAALDHDLPDSRDMQVSWVVKVLAGPVQTALPGLVGLALMALAFLVADRVTPGGRPARRVVRDADPGGAALLSAALVAVGFLAGAQAGSAGFSLVISPGSMLLTGLLGIALMTTAGGLLTLAASGRTRLQATTPTVTWSVAAAYLVVALVLNGGF